MKLERNELNQNSSGGSESVAEGMMERIPAELMEKFQIVTSRVRELKEDKIRVFWEHDTASDPEAQFLKTEEGRNKFHKLVFCGNHQFQQFVNFLGVPYDQRSVIIETPIEPITPVVKKNKNEIRLIYTSTPQRGLEILVPVFEELCKKHDNLVLDVFSSFKIYGWADNDKPFEELFERCRQHPKINYHGFQPNEVVRKALAKADIFTYPSIWQECNSRSLIEAMSAQCLCIHPNYGGLPDTSGGLTTMYQMDQTPNIHAQIFYTIVDQALEIIRKEETSSYLKFVKAFADARYGWNKIASQWEMLLSVLAQQYEGIDLSLPKEKAKQYFQVDTTKR